MKFGTRRPSIGQGGSAAWQWNWEVLHRVHFSHEAGPAQLEDWRRAPDGSQEEIWAEHYDEAMGVLQMGLQ
jgi:hypothetical protein